MAELQMKNSDTVTVEDLKQLGRDIHAIGEGRSRRPSLVSHELGDLLIITAVNQDEEKPSSATPSACPK